MNKLVQAVRVKSDKTIHHLVVLVESYKSGQLFDLQIFGLLFVVLKVGFHESYGCETPRHLLEGFPHVLTGPTITTAELEDGEVVVTGNAVLTVFFACTFTV